MGTEIERKFLVTGDAWRELADEGVFYRQGYLTSCREGLVTPSSVRVRTQGDVAYLNIKSATPGIRRLEFDYPVPVSDATEMLDRLCTGAIIEKTRYHVRVDEHVWEIDVFDGDNAGLVVAEIELSRENEPFSRPDWVGEEVSHDIRYYNSSLAQRPYRDW